MESNAESEVVLQSVQVKIRSQALDLAGVVEEHRIQIAIHHDAPLTLQQQAVAIAESPAAVTTQVAATAQRGQHEVRNLLIAFQPRRLDETTHRDGPRLAKDREMLDDLVIHLLEPERIIPVCVIVERDAVETATARIVGGRTPIDADGGLRVQVGNPSVQTGQ